MEITEKRRLGLYLALYTHRIFLRPTIVIASLLATSIFLFEEYHFLRLD